jgi:two-component system nitrate/nitrite response regulator NarL
MTQVIEIAAVEDNRMFIDGLRAWADGTQDIRLAAVADTVEQLLDSGIGQVDVILLNPALRRGSDPEANVRRLTGAGHRVLVIDGSAEPTMVAQALGAGAHGYLTRDHDLAGLASTLRAIAAGGTAWTLWPVSRARSGGPQARPPLSEREHMVLMAYVSGMTLDSAARQLGISRETARTYLKRVKAKYKQAGLPAYTKLDLANRVHAEYAGEIPVSRPQGALQLVTRHRYAAFRACQS